MICCRTEKFAELRLLIYLIQTFMSVHNFYWARRSDGKDGLSRPHLRVPANVILHSEAGCPIFFGFAHWTITSPLAISKLAMDEGPSIEVGYNYPRKKSSPFWLIVQRPKHRVAQVLVYSLDNPGIICFTSKYETAVILGIGKLWCWSRPICPRGELLS